MSKTYLFHDAEMESVKQKLDQIQEILTQTYQKSEDVKSKIDAQEHWSGNAQKSMAGFLDLLLQFHKDLSSNQEPVVDASESIQTFLTDLEAFPENWEEWKELDSIV